MLASKRKFKYTKKMRFKNINIRIKNVFYFFKYSDDFSTYPVIWNIIIVNFIMIILNKNDTAYKSVFNDSRTYL